MSCLPVPPGPTGAPRCLLLFHPLARPQPRLPEPAPSGSDAAPAPSGGPHAAPPEAGVAAEAAAGCADAAPREGAGQAADPGSRPSAAEEGAAAPGPPPPAGAGSAQGSASAAEDARRASGAGDAGADPDPGVEAAAAARQAAAASVLRGMALVDGVAAGSPFQRCSGGFQARPPRGSRRDAHLSAANAVRVTWVTALHSRTQARAVDCNTKTGCRAKGHGEGVLRAQHVNAELCACYHAVTVPPAHPARGRTARRWRAAVHLCPGKCPCNCKMRLTRGQPLPERAQAAARSSGQPCLACASWTRLSLKHGSTTEARPGARRGARRAHPGSRR